MFSVMSDDEVMKNEENEVWLRFALPSDRSSQREDNLMNSTSVSLLVVLILAYLS